MAISNQIRLKEKVNIFGLMEGNSLVLGSTIKCTVKEILPGRMEEDIKDNIKMTKNTDMDSLSGQTAVDTRDNGLMANSTEKEFIRQLPVM